MDIALACLAILLAVIAIVVSVTNARKGPRRDESSEDALPADVVGLRQAVAALRAEAGDAFKHQAVVRYDAFGHLGGPLLWSLAILDRPAHGLVPTTIPGPPEA